MNVTQEHIDALSKAKIQLMSRPDSAFFTTVCLSLTHTWDDAIPTACTDGTEICINPDYFLGLSPEIRISLLIHESMHVAYLHMLRVQEWMNWRQANIAMDHVINLQLKERHFQISKDWYADPQYSGMKWEDIYPLIGPDPNFKEDIRPGKLLPEDLTREVEDILVRASTQSKISEDAPGTIPGDIQIFLNGLLRPKLPWTKLLSKYLHAFAKNDYSFRKFNKRFFPKHHLPGMVGERLIDLAIAVDISGSVSKKDFHTFVSEIASIFRMMQPDKISLIQFDTEIKSVDVVTSIKELMAVKFAGRGGTAIAPVIAWVEENKPQLLMVFTDGEFHFYQATCKTKTLWLIHNNKKFIPPFGHTIHYTI